jgi:hypothetical protein
MKRFAILCTTSLVLSIPIIGCGDGGSFGSTSNDSSQWGEAKKYKAKMEAEQVARAENFQKKKPQTKKR